MTRKFVRTNSKARFSERVLLPPFRQCLRNWSQESSLPVVRNYSLGTPLTNRHYLRSHISTGWPSGGPLQIFSTRMSSLTTPQRHNTENSKQIYPEKVPKSTVMCLWAIYVFPRSVCLFYAESLLQENMLRDKWMWKLELGPRNSFSGNS